MNYFAGVAPDAKGVPTLTLRGDWDPSVLAYLNRDDWERLSVFHVAWPDYTSLLPVASRISRLSVTGGPERSEGLVGLTSLVDLSVDEPLRPPVDFGHFPTLRRLKVVWDKRNSDSAFGHRALQSLSLERCQLPNLKNVSVGDQVVDLTLIQGALQSLDGLGGFRSLRSIRLVGLRKLEDISAIAQCHSMRSVVIESCPLLSNMEPLTNLSQIEQLSVDRTKYARFKDWNWVESAPRLTSLVAGCGAESNDLAAFFKNTSLRSFAVNTKAGVTISEGDISALAATYGRVLGKVTCFNSKAMGAVVSAEFEE